LFELAEDSRAQLDSYLDSGRVLVALHGPDVIGHLQLVETDRPGEVELKNMAVREDLQGRGVGRQLVSAALGLIPAASASAMIVATATADIGNLRFYQRQGFGCSPSSGMTSLPPPATCPTSASTASTSATGSGWTISSDRNHQLHEVARLSGNLTRVRPPSGGRGRVLIARR